LRDTSGILLDKQASTKLQDQIRNTIESYHGNKVVDLHICAIGANLYNAIISVVTDVLKQPDHYRKMIPDNIGLVHTTIEIHKCDDEELRQ
jgi:Co/Zn/Cd efflux system component